jgi:hypothetical protein
MATSALKRMGGIITQKAGAGEIKAKYQQLCPAVSNQRVVASQSSRASPLMLSHCFAGDEPFKYWGTGKLFALSKDWQPRCGTLLAVHEML